MTARHLLRKIFARIGREPHDKTLRVEFTDGSTYQNYAGDGPCDATIRFKSRWAEWYSLIFFYEGLLEAFVNEWIDLEGERPITALAEMGHRVGMVPVAFWQRLLRNPLNGVRQWAQEMQQNGTDRAQSIRNADSHYAYHPALFEHILGDTVGYSEGLWTPDTTTLDQAKFNNYEYICRKLRLVPGMRVLEVGSGWGYMPIYLAKCYGAEVTVYNPVRRQNDYMRECFARHGLGDRIRLVEGDHRDIAREADAFDRFVSIGVHEHCGYSRRQYRLWAESIAASLKTGGIGVVSTTSFMLRQMTNFLVLKYIFPGGHLPCLGDTLTAFDRAGLMLVEVENLWPHYQRTLVEWRNNLGKHWPEIQKADPEVFTEKFRRRWQMYLEGTIEVFRDSLDLSQIIFTKGRGADFYPRLSGAHHAEAELIGGNTEPECYR